MEDQRQHMGSRATIGEKKQIDLEWILLFFLLVLVVSLNKYL
jgi:hypothetical protein